MSYNMPTVLCSEFQSHSIKIEDICLREGGNDTCNPLGLALRASQKPFQHRNSTNHENFSVEKREVFEKGTAFSVIYRDLSRVKYSILWKQGKASRDKQAFLQGRGRSPRRKISFFQGRENFERNKAFHPRKGKWSRRTKSFVQGTGNLWEVWSLSSKEREVSERGKIVNIYQCIVIAIFPAHVCLLPPRED